MKKWQIVTSVVVALVAVLSLSVAAFAQGNQPPVAPQGYGRGPKGGRGGMFGANAPQGQMPGYGFRFRVNGESLVDITPKVTGPTIEDVVKELQAGKTFADVAEVSGKTAADLVNAFVADRKAVLDKTVADGRLTQTTADTLLATMETNVEQHVNSTWELRGMGYRFTGHQLTHPQVLGLRWTR